MISGGKEYGPYNLRCAAGIQMLASTNYLNFGVKLAERKDIEGYVLI